MTNLLCLGANLPAEVEERADTRRMQSRAETLGKVMRATALVDRLEGAGIPVIVFKGPATGHSAYHDVSLRQFADIDLLLKQSDMNAAHGFVLQLGYKPYFAQADAGGLIKKGHALEFSSDTLKVELHSELLSRYLRVRFDHDEVWATARLLNVGGRQLKVLSSEVQFLFLCAHGAKHEWASIRWICDLTQLVPALDESATARLIDLAEELHARKLLALGLQLVRDVFQSKLPAQLELARQAFDTRSISLEILRAIGIDADGSSLRPSRLRALHPAIPSFLFWARTRERLLDRVLSAGDLLLGHQWNA